MVNDPLRFGDLEPTTPYYIAKPGSPSAPPPLRLTAPAPAPAPRPQVVDRQAYLRQQLQQRDMRERLLREQQQLLEEQRPTRETNARGAMRQTFAKEPPAQLAGPLRAAYDVARTDIPDVIRDPVRKVVSESLQTTLAGGPQARAISEVAGQIPYVKRVTDIPNQVREKIADVAADLVVPVEVWDTMLTLLPAAKARTIPELMAAISVGDVDVVRALRKAGAKFGESETVERAIKGLASERGALEPEKVVPDSVRSLLTKRGQKASTYQVTRKAKEPISEAELAARWESLKPSTQKLITALADVVPTGAERKTIVGAGRARQIAKSQEAVLATRGLPADERAHAIATALKGKIIPGVEPVRTRFTQAATDEIFQDLDDAVDTKAILGVEYARAQSAMNLLFYGERIPGFPGPDNLMPSEVKLLGRIYGPEFEAVLPRTPEELSNWTKAVDIASIPRAIQASLDFSAPGRQGLILGVRNPDYWFQAWKRQWRAAFGGERGWEAVGNEIRSDKHFEDAVQHGVDFTDIGGGATAEEAFVSHWVESIPGVKESGRAYTAFLDYLRLKSYGRGADRIRRTAVKHAADWPADRLNTALDEWGYFVNVASGRGDLGALNKFTPALNAAFFSPRFFVSRPQTIWQLVKPGQDPAVRQMVFENLGLVAGLGTTLLATLKMTGAADVELDPRSTDFGKIRVGPQRIDFFAGFQPLVRYTAQIATRTRVDPYAKENVPTSAWGGVQKFIRSKLSPVGAVGWDFVIAKGRTYEGKEIVGDRPEISVPKYLLDRMTPIGLQDIYEGYTTAGLPGAAGALLSLAGAAVQTYSPTERQDAIQRLEAAGINVTYVDEKAQIRVPQLERDWQSPKWHSLFAADFAELGDTTKYEYANNLRDAYVDYWWGKKGDTTGVGEAQRKRDIGEAFERADSVKQWRKNEAAERLAEWKRNPQLLLDAVRSGLETLNQDEEKILREAGLVR